MKKLIVLIAALGITYSSQALTTSLTVNPTTLTNLLSITQGPIKVTSIVFTASGTNGIGALYDAVPNTTNNLTYLVGSYTNKISYATNYITSWTNYYGVAQSDTNIALIDVNNFVNSSTNYYPIKVGVAALANTSSTYSGVNAYFQNGVMVTNSGTSPFTIIVSYTY